MAQSVGIIDIVWRGRKIKAEKGSKVRLGGIQNKTVVYGRGAARSQEFVESLVECTTILMRGERASDIYTAEEGELQLQLDTGQTVVAPDAWMTDRPDWVGEDGGKIPLKWGFGFYEEIS